MVVVSQWPQKLGYQKWRPQPQCCIQQKGEVSVPISVKCFLKLNKYWLWVRLWCLLFARGISAWAEANYTHPGTWGPSQGAEQCSGHHQYQSGSHTTTNMRNLNTRKSLSIKNQLNHESWTRENVSLRVKLCGWHFMTTETLTGDLATCRICRMSQAPEYREFSPCTCDTSNPGPAAWEPATLNCGEWVDPEGNSEKVFKHMYFNSVKHFKIRVTPECAIMLVLLNIRNKFVKEYPHIFQTKQYIIIYFAISRERINIVYHVHLNRVRYPLVIDT